MIDYKFCIYLFLLRKLRFHRYIRKCMHLDLIWLSSTYCHHHSWWTFWKRICARFKLKITEICHDYTACVMHFSEHKTIQDNTNIDRIGSFEKIKFKNRTNGVHSEQLRMMCHRFHSLQYLVLLIVTVVGGISRCSAPNMLIIHHK